MRMRANVMVVAAAALCACSPKPVEDAGVVVTDAGHDAAVAPADAGRDAGGGFDVPRYDSGLGCGSLTVNGECVGTVLRYCEDDVIIETDCGERGKTCGLQRDFGGFWCIGDIGGDCEVLPTDVCPETVVCVERVCAGAVDGGAGDGGTTDSGSTNDAGSTDAGTPDGGSGSPGRGFPIGAPWLSFYGDAQQMADLPRAASFFRIINIDADPDVGNFTSAQITTLRNGGQNRVISYLNLGACESWRSYWDTAPGFVPCNDNTAAKIGPYGGYPDETWMNVSNTDYQDLIVDYVAPRLVAAGVDGFFLDNLEIIEHGTGTSEGPCDQTCSQGGLDLVRMLRERYPDKLIVMQNATGDVARTGWTGGIAYPTLLDGISHEEVYTGSSAGAESELLAWKAMNLMPGGRPFWIATEDYLGSSDGGCGDATAAEDIYTQSRANGFSPYVTDDSGGQAVVCYWEF